MIISHLFTGKSLSAADRYYLLPHWFCDEKTFFCDTDFGQKYFFNALAPSVISSSLEHWLPLFTTLLADWMMWRRGGLPMWRQLVDSSSSSDQICAASTNYCATNLDASLSFHPCTVIMNDFFIEITTRDFLILSIICFAGKTKVQYILKRIMFLKGLASHRNSKTNFHFSW